MSMFLPLLQKFEELYLTSVEVNLLHCNMHIHALSRISPTAGFLGRQTMVNYKRFVLI